MSDAGSPQPFSKHSVYTTHNTIYTSRVGWRSVYTSACLCRRHAGFPRMCLWSGRYRWQAAVEVLVGSLIVSRYQGVDVFLVRKLLRKTAFGVNGREDACGKPAKACQCVAHSSSAWAHAGQPLEMWSDASRWRLVICLLVSLTQSRGWIGFTVNLCTWTGVQLQLQLWKRWRDHYKIISSSGFTT